MNNYENEFLLAKKIIINCNKKINRRLKKNNKIFDNGKDIKTELDKFSNQYLIDNLKKTKIYILSEEKTYKEVIKNDLMWIIDPIDGTFNLKRGFNIACISISLWKDFKPIFGIIKNIFNEDIYYNIDQSSCWKNNKRIFVSKISKISQSSLATGFPVKMNYSSKNLEEFILNIQKFKKIRMIGSASMSLCYVANGVFDAYYERDIFLWDIAAGISLIHAAGGDYILEKTSNKFKFNLKASNKKIIKKF